MPDRYVTKHPKGWAVKAPGAARASSVHRTQREAEAAAKQTVANLGGGDVRIQGRDGKLRDSDMVPSGNGPKSPHSLRDTMLKISRNAQQRGLTPEILQSILDEE